MKKLLSAIINFRIPISAIRFCIATILLKIMHWTNSEFFHLLCAASGFYHYIENYLKLFFVWPQWFSPMLEITSLLLPYTRFHKGIQMTWHYNLSHDFYNFQIISIFSFYFSLLPNDGISNSRMYLEKKSFWTDFMILQEFVLPSIFWLWNRQS